MVRASRGADGRLFQGLYLSELRRRLRFWWVFPLVGVLQAAGVYVSLMTVVMTSGTPVELLGEWIFTFFWYPLDPASVFEGTSTQILLVHAGAALARATLVFAVLRLADRYGRLRSLATAVRWAVLLLVIVMPAQWLWLRVAHRRSFEDFAERARALPLGSTRAEVREALGPGDRGLYELGRGVSYRSYVWTWFQDGRLDEVDVVPGYDIPFEAEDWRTACPDRRHCMLADLLGSGVLRGVTEEVCLELLGPDSGTSTFRRSGELAYDLGSDRGSSLFPETHWLVLDFEDDRLVGTRIMKD